MEDFRAEVMSRAAGATAALAEHYDGCEVCQSLAPEGPHGEQYKNVACRVARALFDESEASQAAKILVQMNDPVMTIDEWVNQVVANQKPGDELDADRFSELFTEAVAAGKVKP